MDPAFRFHPCFAPPSSDPSTNAPSGSTRATALRVVTSLEFGNARYQSSPARSLRSPPCTRCQPPQSSHHQLTTTPPAAAPLCAHVSWGLPIDALEARLPAGQLRVPHTHLFNPDPALTTYKAALEDQSRRWVSPSSSRDQRRCCFSSALAARRAARGSSHTAGLAGSSTLLEQRTRVAAAGGCPRGLQRGGHRLGSNQPHGDCGGDQQRQRQQRSDCPRPSGAGRQHSNASCGGRKGCSSAAGSEKFAAGRCCQGRWPGGVQGLQRQRRGVLQQPHGV